MNKTALTRKEIPTLTAEQEAAFFAKLETVPTACIVWTGSKGDNGYGRIALSRSVFKAHRVAYVIANGELSPLLDVDHLCCNPSCVNPQHLEAVTPEENQRRKLARIAGEKI